MPSRPSHSTTNTLTPSFWAHSAISNFEYSPAVVRMKPANRAEDIGLVLFTSGTSGSKKVVPLKMHSIVAGIVFVMESWGLTAKDVCLNMMPLYHVQVLSP